jgi:uncharacterized protein (DUF2461 family)
MALQPLVSGRILGLLLGLLLCYRGIQWWQGHEARRRAMDQLIAHFHALFRQIDQEKQQRP